MAQYTFQLRGWQAVLAIAALGGITGVQMYSRVRPVNDATRDAVRLELQKEYSGRGPRDMARLLGEVREGAPPASLSLPPMVQRDVEFRSIAAHGRMGGTVTVVRAEVTVDGGSPPDGRPVRYFWVWRKFGGDGSMMASETDAVRYYMELLAGSRSNNRSY
jgi:hypothetical protein